MDILRVVEETKQFDSERRCIVLNTGAWDESAENVVRFVPAPPECSSPVMLVVADTRYALSSWAVRQVSRSFGLKPWVLWGGLSRTDAASVLNTLAHAGDEQREYVVHIYQNVATGFVPSYRNGVTNHALALGCREFLNDSSFAGWAIEHVSADTVNPGERWAIYLKSDTAQFSADAVDASFGVAVYNSEVGARAPEVVPCAFVDGDGLFEGELPIALMRFGVPITTHAGKAGSSITEAIASAAARLPDAQRSLARGTYDEGLIRASRVARMCEKLGLRDLADSISSTVATYNAYTMLDVARVVVSAGIGKVENVRVKCEEVAGRALTWRL